MQVTMGGGLLSGSALLSIFISIYFVLFGNRSKLLYSFIYCQVLIFIWSAGYIIEIISKDFQIKYIGVCLEGFAICFMGIIWLYFSMLYTDNIFAQNKKLIGSLFFIGVTEYIIILTNDYHGLYYKVFEIDRIIYGIAFGINLFLTYIYVFLSTFIMVRYSLKKIGNEKKQSIILIIAAIIPIIANFLYVSRKIKFDFTPVSFSISLLLIAIAIFKYRFLNAIPTGVRKVFDTVEASIVLIDNNGRIVSKNNSFIETFNEYKGNTVAEFQAYLKRKMIGDIYDELLMRAILQGTLEPVFGEIKVDIRDGKVFRVAIQPLLDKFKRDIGRVVSFTNITSYRELVDQLAKKNVQLTDTNEKLKEHMLVVEELAVLKERNRVAREIHDSLGHTLTFLIKVQEGAILDFGHDNERMIESIKIANKIARQGLKELRLSLYDIMPEKQGTNSLFEKLERLALDFKSSGIKIEITDECEDNYINDDSSQTIFRICQEAVTNSVRHGDADEIHIIIKINDKMLKLFIIDNGKGCIEINKGYGLLGMEERVRKYSGNIVFGSDGESGFNIKVEIPIGDGVT